MQHNRLEKLKHQRKLLLEHLDWINQEIDRESIQLPQSASPKTSRLLETFESDRPVAETLADDPKSQSQVAAELYGELGPDTKSAATETKRGCLIIGALAFLSLAALIAYVVFWY